MRPKPLCPHNWSRYAGEGKQFTPTMTLGVALALAGFMLYSHTKVLAYRRWVVQGWCWGLFCMLVPVRGHLNFQNGT